MIKFTIIIIVTYLIIIALRVFFYHIGAIEDDTPNDQ